MRSRRGDQKSSRGRGIRASIPVWAGMARTASFLLFALAVGIVVLPLIATRTAAQEAAPTYTVLYNFTGGPDGSEPDAGLIPDADGNLYGTTSYGGDAVGLDGDGVVFKLDPFGNETVIYTFTGGADGAHPAAGLVRDAAGNLYGTTSGGGDTGSTCPNGSLGCGVVFRLDPAGNERLLHSLTGGADGASPDASLIHDASGNLYGTTSGGGKIGEACYLGGCGVVFKLDLSGNETVLHTFTGGPDGTEPSAGLVRDAAGNLYGTTQAGGETSGACAPYGCGVVFKLDPSGNETLLHSLSGGLNGSTSVGRLVLDAAGNLYGTTGRGGKTSGSCTQFGCGVVFKVDPAGNETVLYIFRGGSDGNGPYGDLTRDTAGMLYGTTASGGNLSYCSGFGCGVVFEVSPAGKETAIYSFTGGADGANPQGGLWPYNGFLYGTTPNGGDQSDGLDDGVVFKISLH